MDKPITVIKVPMFYGRGFFAEIFEAAAAAGAQVVVIKGSCRFYSVHGGGATLNVIDRLFGFRGTGSAPGKGANDA